MLVSLSCCLEPIHCVGTKVLKQIFYFIQMLQARKHLITCTQNKFHSSQLLNFFFFYFFLTIALHFFCASLVLLCLDNLREIIFVHDENSSTHNAFQLPNWFQPRNTLIKQLCNSNQAAYSKLIRLQIAPVDTQRTLSKQDMGFFSVWFNCDVSWVFLYVLSLN